MKNDRNIQHRLEEEETGRSKQVKRIVESVEDKR